MAKKGAVLTARELAEYIKIHEKTVIKQAQEGKLPGIKIGNQWRFHIDAIDEHLQSDFVKIPDDDLDAIITTADNIIPISRLTDDRLIVLNSKARTIDEVLSEISTVAHKARLLDDAAAFLALLREREAMMSTAVGWGYAVPHPRNPVEGMFARPNIIMLRTSEKIPHDAPDRRPVQFFITVCAPNEFVHLRLLAKVSKLLHFEEAHEKMLTVTKKKDLIRILLEFDRQRIFPLVKK